MNYHDSTNWLLRFCETEEILRDLTLFPSIKSSLKNRDFIRFCKKPNNDVTSLRQKNGNELSLKKKEDGERQRRRTIKKKICNNTNGPSKRFSTVLQPATLIVRTRRGSLRSSYFSTKLLRSAYRASCGHSRANFFSDHLVSCLIW